MKRIAALLIVLLLVLSVAALAEAYDKPILFRGIEWGSSYEDLLNKEGLLGNIHNLTGHGTEYDMYRGEDAPFDEKLGLRDDYSSAITDEMTVGGYKVWNASMNFAYTPDESGALVKDGVHTALYLAEYRITDYHDGTEEEAFDDLTQKLSSLYGDVDLQHETVAPFGNYENAKWFSNVWYGADGTMVALNRIENRGFRIVYSCGDVYLQNAKANEESEEEAFRADTEGL